MKSAILENGEDYYTDMKKLFNKMENFQTDFNWLITNLETNIPFKYKEYNRNNYLWISGDEFTELVNECTVTLQFIWAVCSGFSKDIGLDDILKRELPYADGNPDFWKPTVNIQHPLADIEIVAWDCTSTLFMSRDKYLVKRFMKKFQRAQNLEIYNREVRDKYLV